MKIKLFIVFLHQHQEFKHQQHVCLISNFRFCHSKFHLFLAVFLSPPSSSSSSSLSTTTTSLHIDCNIKTETTNNHNTAAITRAFDNLAKAAAHVIICLCILLFLFIFYIN